MRDESQLSAGCSRFLGDPRVSGRIRAEPEDFRVSEIPLFEPDGEGGHLWLEIEKRNANTDWVARQLANHAGAAARDIGFAGMKDRRGVTSQWFSVALQEAASADWENWEIPDVTILQARLHRRKLKRGTLAGNRFRIVVRELEGEVAVLEERLQTVAENGVPNYFGPQRFGHGGANVERGIQWLAHGGRLARNRRSIYLSAVRSWLFNDLLSRRVDLGNWNRILDGEIASLDGSRSTFSCAMPDAELDRRCASFDIHPSGPLPGSGDSHPERDAGDIEREVLEIHCEVIASLERAGLRSARRSLRLRPRGLAWEIGDGSLVLEFGLPPGGYATSLLRELVSTSPGTISDSR